MSSSHKKAPTETADALYHEVMRLYIQRSDINPEKDVLLKTVEIQNRNKYLQQPDIRKEIETYVATHKCPEKTAIEEVIKSNKISFTSTFQALLQDKNPGAHAILKKHQEAEMKFPTVRAQYLKAVSEQKFNKVLLAVNEVTKALEEESDLKSEAYEAGVQDIKSFQEEIASHQMAKLIDESTKKLAEEKDRMMQLAGNTDYRVLLEIDEHIMLTGSVAALKAAIEIEALQREFEAAARHFVTRYEYDEKEEPKSLREKESELAEEIKLANKKVVFFQNLKNVTTKVIDTIEKKEDELKLSNNDRITSIEIKRVFGEKLKHFDQLVKRELAETDSLSKSQSKLKLEKNTVEYKNKIQQETQIKSDRNKFEVLVGQSKKIIPQAEWSDQGFEYRGVASLSKEMRKLRESLDDYDAAKLGPSFDMVTKLQKDIDGELDNIEKRLSELKTSIAEYKFEGVVDKLRGICKKYNNQIKAKLKTEFQKFNIEDLNLIENEMNSQEDRRGYNKGDQTAFIEIQKPKSAKIYLSKIDASTPLLLPMGPILDKQWQVQRLIDILINDSHDLTKLAEFLQLLPNVEGLISAHRNRYAGMGGFFRSISKAVGDEKRSLSDGGMFIKDLEEVIEGNRFLKDALDGNRGVNQALSLRRD